MLVDNSESIAHTFFFFTITVRLSVGSMMLNRVCQFYQRGMCRKGETCIFLHVIDQTSQQAHPLDQSSRPNDPCLLYLLSACPHPEDGVMCSRAHVEQTSIEGSECLERYRASGGVSGLGWKCKECGSVNGQSMASCRNCGLKNQRWV